MARYQGINSLSHYKWLTVYADYANYLYYFRVEHRGIFIKDKLGAEDEKNLQKVVGLIVGMQKAVNYYLDAIWC